MRLPSEFNWRSVTIGIVVLIVTALLWFLIGRNNNSAVSQIQPLTDGKILQDLPIVKAIPASVNSESIVSNSTDLTPEGQRALYNRLQKMGSVELFGVWRKAIQSGEHPAVIATIGNALGYVLKTFSDSHDPYADITSYLADSSTSVSSKIQILTVLGGVPKENSLKILLNTSRIAGNSELKRTALDAIGRISADLQYGPEFHEELSPAFETELSLVKGDALAGPVIANALASIGSASGVRLLLDQLNQGDMRLLSAKNADGDWVRIVLEALKHIDNPDALAVFSNCLPDTGSLTLRQYGCGIALATMGWPESTHIIIGWGQQRKDDVSEYLTKWLSMVRDAGSIEVLSRSSIIPLKFNNDTNRKAVMNLTTD